MPEIEIVNVVGMITYEQELDLSALADAFSTCDGITDVTYDPAENHWLQLSKTVMRSVYAFSPGRTILRIYVFRS